MLRYKRRNTLHDKPGNPYALNNLHLEEVREACDGALKAKKPLSVLETTQLIQAKANEHRKKRNLDPVTLHASTVRSIKIRANISDVIPQTISDARLKACSDTRMSYSMYIMLKPFTEKLPKQLIWNFDATQFVCQKSGSGKHVCIVKDKRDDTPVTAVGDETLDIAIKWLHMGSAAGEAIPLVFLVSIPDMNDTDFVVYEVPGLNQYGVSEICGYVAFCRTRAGNENFFTWFIREVAIPKVCKVRDVYSLQVRVILL